MRSAIAIATMAALGVTAAPAAGTSGRLADFDLNLSSTTPSSPTGMTFQAKFHRAEDPNAKPAPIRSAVVRLPNGLRYDSGALPECMASDEQIRAEGSDACPPEMELTVGALTAITGFGSPPDPISGDDHVFNAPSQIIEIVTAPGAPVSPGFDRLTIQGSTLTAHPPVTPGGPPDGQTAIRTIDFAIPVKVARGRALITTPPTCPTSGKWSTTAVFSFGDGSNDTVSADTPCSRSAAPGGTLWLTVRPRRVRAGHAVRFRFRADSTTARCIAGARLHFAGRRVRTDANGRATITTTLHAPGIRRARVSHVNCGRAVARVRVRRAR